MTFRQGAQHRRCRSLTFAWTITPDCERHELWNRADIFFVPIRESMLKSFVSYKTFLVRSQKGKKKCVSKDIFCSPTTIVDDDNNKHRCRQCPSKSRAVSLWTTNATPIFVSQKFRGVLPEKLGEDVRHAFRNPYPISDQKLWFSLPYFKPDQKFDTVFQTWSPGARRVTGARDKLLRHVHGTWRKH